jgi:rRNA pseudouridine-1189 N-methylase Emg1 (Nep1/Mra1 family)
MQNLITLITELENKIAFINQKNEAVSKVTVGWHLEHSLLALIKMISAVEHSHPSDYKWKFNLKRTIIIAIGKFPRGKAKAPTSVLPGEKVNIATIIPMIEKAKQKVMLLDKLGNDKFFIHPVFGDLRLKQARRVITIHTNHHIKIINDIISGK